MKKEMSMELRLLLAFLLMGAVLLVSQSLIKPAAAPTATQSGAAKSAQPVRQAEVQTPAAPIQPAAAAEAEPGKASAGEVKADREEAVAVDTAVYHVVFSNRGAVVRN